MFEHKKIEIPKLQRVEINGRRHYVTPEGFRYASITTALSILSRDSIREWRNRVGEEEANRISGIASSRGTKIHKMCEDYLNNELSMEKILPVHKEMFLSIKPILDEKINTIYVQEEQLWSDYLKIAGTVDCIAEFDGVLSVIDFKTSKRLKKKEEISGYFQQASAYCVMFEERTKIPVNQIVILIAVDNESPQVFIEKRDNYIWDCIDTIGKYYKEYPNE